MSASKNDTFTDNKGASLQKHLSTLNSAETSAHQKNPSSATSKSAPFKTPGLNGFRQFSPRLSTRHSDIQTRSQSFNQSDVKKLDSFNFSRPKTTETENVTSKKTENSDLKTDEATGDKNYSMPVKREPVITRDERRKIKGLFPKKPTITLSESPISSKTPKSDAHASKMPNFATPTSPIGPPPRPLASSSKENSLELLESGEDRFQKEDKVISGRPHPLQKTGILATSSGSLGSGSSGKAVSFSKVILKKEIEGRETRIPVVVVRRSNSDVPSRNSSVKGSRESLLHVQIGGKPGNSGLENSIVVNKVEKGSDDDVTVDPVVVTSEGPDQGVVMNINVHVDKSKHHKRKNRSRESLVSSDADQVDPTGKSNNAITEEQETSDQSLDISKLSGKSEAKHTQTEEASLPVDTTENVLESLPQNERMNSSFQIRLNNSNASLNTSRRGTGKTTTVAIPGLTDHEDVNLTKAGMKLSEQLAENTSMLTQLVALADDHNDYDDSSNQGSSSKRYERPSHRSKEVSTPRRNSLPLYVLRDAHNIHTREPQTNTSFGEAAEPRNCYPSYEHLVRRYPETYLALRSQMSPMFGANLSHSRFVPNADLAKEPFVSADRMSVVNTSNSTMSKFEKPNFQYQPATNGNPASNSELENSQRPPVDSFERMRATSKINTSRYKSKLNTPDSQPAQNARFDDVSIEDLENATQNGQKYKNSNDPGKSIFGHNWGLPQRQQHPMYPALQQYRHKGDFKASLRRSASSNQRPTGSSFAPTQMTYHPTSQSYHHPAPFYGRGSSNSSTQNPSVPIRRSGSFTYVPWSGYSPKTSADETTLERCDSCYSIIPGNTTPIATQHTEDAACKENRWRLIAEQFRNQRLQAIQRTANAFRSDGIFDPDELPQRPFVYSYPTTNAHMKPFMSSRGR